MEEGLLGNEAEATRERTSSRHSNVSATSAESGPRRRRQSSLISVTHDGREQWGSRAEFLLTAVGMAVGVGNVWRFPYLVFENGGGVFLIPYLCALVFLGIPMFMLEVAIGQRFRKGGYHSMLAIHPRWKGVGLACASISACGALYYNMLIAWSLFYFAASFKFDELPFSYNPEHFWYHRVLEISRGYFDWTSWNWKIFFALAVAWILVYFIIRKGIATSGKAVYLTATLPYVLLFVLLIRGVTLKGAGKGIEFYLKPDFKKLYNIQMWVTAAGQIFYSLGPGWGTLAAYGSYNPKEENLMVDSILVASINSATSLLAGFGIFSILGYLALKEDKAVAEVVSGGTGLAFVVYPSGLALLPGAPIWCLCFFGMLVFLGIDSQFAMVEVILTLAKDLEWLDLSGDEVKAEEGGDAAPKSKSPNIDWILGRNGKRGKIPQETFMAIVCGVLFALGIILFTTSAGIYFFNFFNQWMGFALMPLCMMECVAVGWTYGAKRILDELGEHIDGNLFKGWWIFLWKWFIPPLLMFLTLASIYTSVMNPESLLSFSYPINRLPSPSPYQPFYDHIPDFLHPAPPTSLVPVVKYQEAPFALFMGFFIGLSPLIVIFWFMFKEMWDEGTRKKQGLPAQPEKEMKEKRGRGFTLQRQEVL